MVITYNFIDKFNLLQYIMTDFLSKASCKARLQMPYHSSNKRYETMQNFGYFYEYILVGERNINFILKCNSNTINYIYRLSPNFIRDLILSIRESG